MATKISSPFVLLVEGKDEANVFTQIRSIVGFESLQVVDIGGQDKFRPALEALANQRAFTQLQLLGIVRDCEEDGAAVFRSVVGSLAAVGVAGPERRGEFAGTTPRVIVELLPPGRETGCLETLFVEAAESVDSARCHHALTECVRSLPSAAQFTRARFDKISALAIMSSFHPKYYTRVGLALQAAEFRPFLDAAPLRPLWSIVEEMHRVSREV